MSYVRRKMQWGCYFTQCNAIEYKVREANKNRNAALKFKDNYP